MKMVEAIIKPFKLDDVKDALHDLGVLGMTVLDAKGIGRQTGHAQVHRGAEYEVDLLVNVKVEIVINDDMVETVVNCIRTAAYTGQIGDGKIFVRAIEEALRIRTGETGASAL